MSHFSAIGFNVETIDDYNLLIEQSLQVATEYSTHESLTYLRYTDPSGAEIWLCANNDKKEIVGATPCFTSKNTQKVGINAVIPIENGEYGDGTVHGWLNATDYDEKDGWLDGYYPVIIDVPNYLDYCDDDKIHQASLTLFAENVDIFDDENDFDQWQKQDGRDFSFSSEFFGPSGMFTDDEQSEPTAIVLAGLTVLEAEKRLNTLSNNEFYWCRVGTYGGEYEAVFPLDMFDDVPKVGNIIFGHYWLTGRFK